MQPHRPQYYPKQQNTQPRGPPKYLLDSDNAYQPILGHSPQRPLPYPNQMTHTSPKTLPQSFSNKPQQLTQSASSASILQLSQRRQQAAAASEVSREKKRANWSKPQVGGAARAGGRQGQGQVVDVRDRGSIQVVTQVQMAQNKIIGEEWMPEDEFFSSDSMSTENQDMAVGRESLAEMTPPKTKNNTNPNIDRYADHPNFELNDQQFKVQQNEQFFAQGGAHGNDINSSPQKMVGFDGNSRQIVSEHRSQEVSSKPSGQKLNLKHQRSEDDLPLMKLSQNGFGLQPGYVQGQTPSEQPIFNNFASQSQIQGQNNNNVSGSLAQGQQQSRPSLTAKDGPLITTQGKYGFEANNVRFHPHSRQKTPHTPIPHQGANDSSQFLYQSNLIINAGNQDEDPEDADQSVDDIADENNYRGGTATQNSQMQHSSNFNDQDSMFQYQMETKVLNVDQSPLILQSNQHHPKNQFKYQPKTNIMGNPVIKYDFKSSTQGQQLSKSNKSSSVKMAGNDQQQVVGTQHLRQKYQVDLQNSQVSYQQQNHMQSNWNGSLRSSQQVMLQQQMPDEWIVVAPKSSEIPIMTPRIEQRRFDYEIDQQDSENDLMGFQSSKRAQLRTCRSGDTLQRNTPYISIDTIHQENLQYQHQATIQNHVSSNSNLPQAHSCSKLENYLQVQETQKKNNGSQFSESFVKNQWQFQRKTPSRRKKGGENMMMNNHNQSSQGRQQSGIYIGQRGETSPEMPPILQQSSPSNAMMSSTMARSQTSSNLKQSLKKSNNKFQMNRDLNQFKQSLHQKGTKPVIMAPKTTRQRPFVSPLRQSGYTFGSTNQLQPVMAHSHLVLSPSHQQYVKPFPSVAKLDSRLALKQSYQYQQNKSDEQLYTGPQHHQAITVIQQACPHCHHQVTLSEQNTVQMTISENRQQMSQMNQHKKSIEVGASKIQKTQIIQPKTIMGSPKMNKQAFLPRKSNNTSRQKVTDKLPQKIVSAVSNKSALESRSLAHSNNHQYSSSHHQLAGMNPYTELIYTQQQSQMGVSRESKVSSLVHIQLQKGSQQSKDIDRQHQREFSASSSQIGSPRMGKYGATNSVQIPNTYSERIDNQNYYQHEMLIEKNSPIPNLIQKESSVQIDQMVQRSQAESSAGGGSTSGAGGQNQLRNHLKSPKRLNLVKKSYQMQVTRGSATDEGSLEFNQIQSNGMAATLDQRKYNEFRSQSRGGRSSRQKVKNDSRRAAGSRNQTKETVLDRFEKYEQKKEMKLMMKKMQKQESEMESCSFKPKIESIDGNINANKKPRDIQQFVKDQQAFLENRQAKKDILRKQKEQEELSKQQMVTKINDKSKQILREKQKRELVSQDYKSFVEEMRADGVLPEKDALKTKMMKSTLSNDMSITATQKNNIIKTSSSQISILKSELQAGSPLRSTNKHKMSSNVSPMQMSKQSPGNTIPSAPTQKQYAQLQKSPRENNIALDTVRSASSNSRRFLPKINKNTEKILENRRKRKEESQRALQTNKSSKQEGSGSKNEAPSQLKQSDRYLLMKFNREFILAVQTVRRDFLLKAKEEKQKAQGPMSDKKYSQNKSSDGDFDINSEMSLDFDMFKQVLYRLGLIQDEQGIDPSVIQKQEKMIYVMWRILGGSDDLNGSIQEYHLQPIVQFICRLVDGRHIKIDLGDDDDGQDNDSTNNLQDKKDKGDEFLNLNIKNNTDDDVTLTIVEILKVQKYFYSFYINRQQVQGQLIDIRRTIRLKEDQKQMTFQPKLVSKQIEQTRTSPRPKASARAASGSQNQLHQKSNEDPYQYKSNHKQTVSGTQQLQSGEGSMFISRIDASSNFGSSNMHISKYQPESDTKQSQLQVLADIEMIEQRLMSQVNQIHEVQETQATHEVQDAVEVVQIEEALESPVVDQPPLIHEAPVVLEASEPAMMAETQVQSKEKRPVKTLKAAPPSNGKKKAQQNSDEKEKPHVEKTDRVTRKQTRIELTKSEAQGSYSHRDTPHIPQINIPISNKKMEDKVPETTIDNREKKKPAKGKFNALFQQHNSQQVDQIMFISF